MAQSESLGPDKVKQAKGKLLNNYFVAVQADDHTKEKAEKSD